MTPNNQISAVNDVNRLVATALRINHAIADGTIEDANESEDYREPLAYDTVTTIQVLLSCGGPTERVEFDYIKVTVFFFFKLFNRFMITEPDFN